MTRKDRKAPVPRSKSGDPSKGLPPKRLGEEVALADYRQLLDSLKDQIQAAQMQAALSVNSQLIALYFNLGRAIVNRQEQAGW